MIDIDKVQYGSMFAGLAEATTVPFSVDIPSQFMLDGAAVVYLASIPVPKANAFMGINTQFTGLESEWRLLDGFAYWIEPGFAYSISLRTYISGGILYVRAFILNFSGGDITLPAFTLSCSASLYDAPTAG